MARKPMVTRTIVTTKVTVLGVDVNTAEAFNETYTLPRSYADDKKLLKACKDYFEDDNIKIVQVVNKEEVETLYGMTEQAFIENADMLDPETRKPINTIESNSLV